GEETVLLAHLNRSLRDGPHPANPSGIAAPLLDLIAWVCCRSTPRFTHPPDGAPWRACQPLPLGHRTRRRGFLPRPSMAPARRSLRNLRPPAGIPCSSRSLMNHEVEGIKIPPT